MKNEKRKESVSIIYKDDVISLTGDTFQITGSLPTSELTKIYMGSKGRTVATLTIELPVTEPSQNTLIKKITINDLIDELANKGLSEDDIMKTEVIV